MTSTHALNILDAGLIALSGSVVYLNTLTAGFTYDDKVAVQGNPDVISSNVYYTDVLKHDFWGNDLFSQRDQGGWTHFSWRPLVTITFRWDFLRAGQRLDPFFFHATNVAIHAIACVAAYFALRAVTGFQHRGRALLASLLFSLHPVHTECVANVTSRSDVLSAVFQFVAIAVHASGPMMQPPGRMRNDEKHGVTSRREYGTHVDDVSTRSVTGKGGYRAACRELIRAVLIFVCLCAALMCKETALVLPALLCCLDVVHAAGRCLQDAEVTTIGGDGRVASIQRPHYQQRRFSRVLHYMYRSGCFFRCIVYAATICFLYWARVRVMARGYDLSGFANPIHNPLAGVESGAGKLLSLLYVQAFALWQMVLPITLQHEHHSMDLIDRWDDPKNVFSLGVLVVFAAISGVALSCWFGALRAATTEATAAVSTRKDGTGGPESPTHAVTRFGSCSSKSQGAVCIDHLREDLDDPLASRLGVACRLTYGLLFMALGYAPSSHLVVFVAFLVAERTAFLPSLGACLVIAEVLAFVSETKHGIVSSSSVSGNDPPVVSGNPVIGQTNHQSRCSIRYLGSWGVGAMLCTYFAARTYVRTKDWVSEETLLVSSLRTYPNNGMSMYGLGAHALYDASVERSGRESEHTVNDDGPSPRSWKQARLAEAERWLVSACNLTSLAEPRILLSQLYWRHGVNGDMQAGLVRAEEVLRSLENTSSPRKEVLTNLGLLMYARASHLPPRELARAEYLVLAAHVAHGYPPRHTSIATLANNAGCMRMLSHPARYGHAELADEAFRESMDLQEDVAGFKANNGFTSGGVVPVPAVYHNAAVLYAIVYEDVTRAQAVIARGTAVLRRSLAHLEGEGSPATAFYRGHLSSLDRLSLALRSHAGTIWAWGVHDPDIGASIGALPMLQDGEGRDSVGRANSAVQPPSVAQRRLKMLGVECTMELLWW